MLPMKSMRHRVAIIGGVLLAASALTAARAAEPAVLTKIPDDAYGVVVINSVRAFSNKLSNAGTRLNLTIPPDIAGYITRRWGITKGFDANSSAALVFLQPTPARLAEGYFNGTPPMVLLLPTSDPHGMLEPFKPGDPDKAGIMQVVLPEDTSQKGYVAIVDDKWIAYSTDRADIETYQARTGSFAAKASPETRKVFDANDLVVWGNVSKLSLGADKFIDDALIDFGGRVELRNVAMNLDPFAAAVQRQAVGMAFAFGKEFVKDADANMVTVRLTDSGATFGLVGDFKSASPIGKFVASQKGAKPISLSGLPGVTGGNFLLAGAGSWDSATMAATIANFGDTLLSDPAISKDPRAADLRQSIDRMKQAMALTTGASVLLMDPPAGGKDGYISGAALIESPDPDKLLDVYFASLSSTLLQTSVNPDMKPVVTTARDAVTIKGVKLARLNIKIGLRDETPDHPIAPFNREMGELLQNVYGADGLTCYLGVIGKHVIVIYGSDPPTLEAAVTAAQTNADNFAANPVINATRDQLVPNPVAVAYLPVTRWVTLVQSVLRPGSGDRAPLAPAIINAPPVVMSVGVTGSMMTAELHVPIATISGVEAAYDRLSRAMDGPGVLP